MRFRIQTAAVALAALLAVGSARAEDGVENLSAPEVLERCRAMLPAAPVKISGTIIVRNRKGIPSAEYDYTLAMNRTAVPATICVEVRERDGTNVLDKVELKRPGPVPEGRVMKTDVRWTDLALDFLWWPEAEYEAEREGESVHGQKCTVIIAKNGAEKMRLWADRKTGCLMQAEELDGNGEAKRRIWGTRLKKFGERWMANVLEVEAPGSGRRTKITVEDLKEENQ